MLSIGAEIVAADANRRAESMHDDLAFIDQIANMPLGEPQDPGDLGDGQEFVCVCRRPTFESPLGFGRLLNVFD